MPARSRDRGRGRDRRLACRDRAGIHDHRRRLGDDQHAGDHPDGDGGRECRRGLVIGDVAATVDWPAETAPAFTTTVAVSATINTLAITQTATVVVNAGAVS